MTPSAFVVSLAVLLSAVFSWAFRALPRERWQMLATIPLQRAEDGGFRGVNLTFYGFFVATACALGVVMYLVLARSLGLSLATIFTVGVLAMAAAVPGTKIVVWIVERQAANFTVSGAGFVGLAVAPWAIWWRAGAESVTPMLTALAIAFVFAEGFGRLACISFGCCYGKRVSDFEGPWRRLFERIRVTFHGRTKKIAYASRLAGTPVVPIQAMTSIVLTLLALSGTMLFLESRPGAALLVALIGSLLWRMGSEFLRADDRGGGRFSAYQWLSLIQVAYITAIVGAFGRGADVAPDLAAGLAVLADPWVILCLQGFWGMIFLYTGVSMVTESSISFRARQAGR